MNSVFRLQPAHVIPDKDLEYSDRAVWSVGSLTQSKAFSVSLSHSFPRTHLQAHIHTICQGSINALPFYLFCSFLRPPLMVCHLISLHHLRGPRMPIVPLCRPVNSSTPAWLRCDKTSPMCRWVFVYARESVSQEKKSINVQGWVSVCVPVLCVPRSKLPAAPQMGKITPLWTAGGANEKQKSWQSETSVCPHAGCTFCPDLYAFGRQPMFSSSAPPRSHIFALPIKL